MVKKGIFSKIFVLLISISLTVGIVISIVNLRGRTQDLEEALIQENKLLVQTAASLIETTHRAQILPFITLKKIAEAENTSFLWIVKPTGEIYYADDPQMFGKVIDDPSLGTKELIVKDNIDPKTGKKIKLIVFPLKIEATEKPWSLFLGVSLEKLATAKKKIIFTTLSFFALVLVTSIPISFYLAKTILAPLDRLREGVEIIGKGNLDYRAQIKTGDEIEELAEAFNRMAERLQKSYAALEESKTVLEIAKEERTIALIRQKALAQDSQRKAAELEKKIKELQDHRKALMNILSDVEEARANLETEKNKTLAVIENLADGILVLDSERRIILVNYFAEKFLQVSRQDVQHKRIEDLSHLPSFQKLLSLLLKKFYATREELSLSENLILEVTHLPLIFEKKRIGEIIILHDITREKFVERLKTEFVSLSAHQLRTPLSGIKWALAMALEEPKLDEKSRKDLIKKAFLANERLIRIVNDLLDVTRIEEGRYIYKLTSVDFVKIVKEVLELYSQKAKEKNIDLKVFLPEIEVNVEADAEKIKIAVQNLVENAIFYTPSGKEVEIGLKTKEKELEFYVRDQGIGIPKSERSRVFTKFYRSAKAMRMETEGSGLGLFITKNIIEAHGGKIWFESEEGKGSTFYFTLPYKKVEENIKK